MTPLTGHRYDGVSVGPFLQEGIIVTKKRPPEWPEMVRGGCAVVMLAAVGVVAAGVYTVVGVLI